MKGLLLLAFAMFFIGCSSKNLDSYSDTSAKRSFETIMKINAVCQPCNKSSYETIIDGKSYKSDVAINCCPNIRKIDTSAGLTKVYLHRVSDLRENQKAIFVNGSKEAYDLNKRIDSLFFLSLKEELKNRGIVLVNHQTSPYTLRVDFDFTGFKGVYNPKYENLNSKLYGVLNIKNINYTRHIKISTTQNVSGLRGTGEFGIYMDLLVKQAANKAAEEISKF
ncbi:hypothetical protein [Campylobacter hyointestinalis]|uniref:Outer membrane liproprotein n=2 Tax=Campylobacter hyointestinalis TaxID=198 RepID=A0AAV6EH32_CAMHY|nr:hypothetical protein [Campylobacter hyointestinalis]ANE34996.1 outer membrane liproprotein [Campylobacter hyointestinalis subsp. lawsonii CCUG 27631]KAB0614437.1 hypothetical protein F7P66_02280 [Campylobacter hyointestinalis subsp. lawsonii]QKF70191.1 outer membrane lipoprotein [Campylobacter hyointestinalis subsp. lawsonii]RAZ28699.1 hypothetical protein CHLT_03515 [Campylobacter hyointestinalis subsp. lawsonii]RAZ60157.1 hypothetical protein CHL10071_07525 [Campylobacter hyointestinalis 